MFIFFKYEEYGLIIEQNIIPMLLELQNCDEAKNLMNELLKIHT